VHARDDEGKSPLDYAMERKHAEVADFLRARDVR
jgi:ankyrin repeat protein